MTVMQEVIAGVLLLFIKMGRSWPLFLYFRLFSIFTVQLEDKILPMAGQDSNRGSLVLSLPTEPPHLPIVGVLTAHNQEASLMPKASTEVIVTKLCRFVVELFVGSKGLLSLTSLTIVVFEPPLAPSTSTITFLPQLTLSQDPLMAMEARYLRLSSFVCNQSRLNFIHIKIKGRLS